MTEDEFKTNYIRSYLAAYSNAVGSTLVKPKITIQNADQLLQLAKKNAERAWQQYLKENRNGGSV